MALIYISDIADFSTVNKIRQIINSIDIDNISTPAFIEEFLVENKHSIFPQIMYTQRPDRVSANLSDGRVVLVVDGIPFAYILPCQLPMLMQSPDDYAKIDFLIGSSLWIIRYLSMIHYFIFTGILYCRHHLSKSDATGTISPINSSSKAKCTIFLRFRGFGTFNFLLKF